LLIFIEYQNSIKVNQSYKLNTQNTTRYIYTQQYLECGRGKISITCDIIDLANIIKIQINKL